MENKVRESDRNYTRFGRDYGEMCLLQRGLAMREAG